MTAMDETLAALPRWGFAFPGPMRDELTALALAGAKTTTAGLLVEYELDGETIAQPGDLSLLLDSAGEPVAVVETETTRVARLADVDDQHAIDEGEGYGNAAEFRVAHERFWNGYLDDLRARLGDPGLALYGRHARRARALPDRAVWQVRMRSVWFGLHLPSYTFPDTPPERLFDRVVEQARAAEEAGLRPRHGDGPPLPDPRRRARRTSRCSRRGRRSRRSPARRRGCGSGPLVTGVTYRNPALLAKTVTTLDVISGGRAILGLGRRLERGRARRLRLRVPAGPRADGPPRRGADDRAAMFTEERPTFHGRYYEIRDALNVPRPVQPGGPRILVGGGGEQRTLRIAAKHADMTHWFPLGLEALAHKTEVLRGYCEAIGRDPATIERTMATPVIVAATEAEATRRSTACRPSAARRVGRHAGAGGRGAPARTSTPASPGSRSTTPSTARRSRSRSSASCWSSSRRILVASYSRTGTTARVAGRVAAFLLALALEVVEVAIVTRRTPYAFGSASSLPGAPSSRRSLPEAATFDARPWRCKWSLACPPQPGPRPVRPRA